jgi:hypothetical protein
MKVLDVLRNVLVFLMIVWWVVSSVCAPILAAHYALGGEVGGAWLFTACSIWLWGLWTHLALKIRRQAASSQ